jgi:hypothetical protein
MTPEGAESMSGAKMAAIGGVLLAALMAVTLAVGFPSSGSKGPAGGGTGAATGEEYRNTTVGFAVTAPEGWTPEMDPKKILGAAAAFFGPRRSDTTVQMSIRFEERPTELKAYVDRSVKRQLPELLTDFNIVQEDSDLTLPDETVKANEVICTYVQGSLNMTAVVVVCGLNDWKVTVAYAVPSDYYEEFRLPIENSINTFHRL